MKVMKPLRRIIAAACVLCMLPGVVWADEVTPVETEGVLETEIEAEVLESLESDLGDIIEESTVIEDGDTSASDADIMPVDQVTEEPFELSVEVDDNERTLTATLKVNGDTSKITRIGFPIWTQANGQDDIIWHVATKVDETTWQLKINLSLYDNQNGIYEVHSYAYYKDGTYECAGMEKVEVNEPKINVLSVVSKDETTGDFKVKLSNVSVSGTITKLYFPIWSEVNGQDDIIWYEAAKSGSSWVADVDVSDHGNDTGKYYVHAYYLGTDSKFHFISDITTQVTLSDADVPETEVPETEEPETEEPETEVPETEEPETEVPETEEPETEEPEVQDPSLDVAVNGEQSVITVTLSNVDKNVTLVRFPVWTEANNQDDIVWYTATKVNDTTYRAEVSIKNHQSQTGKYLIHAYTYVNSQATFAGATDVEIAPISGISEIKITDLNTAMGNFRAQVTVANIPAQITMVRFAVWSQVDGQDDIVWYVAKQSGNTFYADILAANHNYSEGTYEIHCYPLDARGVQQFAGKATKSITVTQRSGFSVDTDGNTYYYNTDGTKATGWKKIDGVKYYFDTTTGAMKTGWNYIGGYKLYFNADGSLVQNVDPIIGRQSQYYLKVNTSTNTVTIFAKDGSNGYIIPVRKMVCSTGLSATPTIKGTFTVRRLTKWRTLMGGVSGQYTSQISGGYLFHSAWYYEYGNNKTLSVSEYKKLGQNASHGCVRLTVADAKWIYDYCNGSTVYVYSGSDTCPFDKPGRPNPVVISGDYGYDPTDPAI